jgi:hypothetical protein
MRGEKVFVDAGGELGCEILSTTARSSRRRWWTREREGEEGDSARGGGVGVGGRRERARGRARGVIRNRGRVGVVGI